MAFAISIKASGPTGSKISNLWSKFSQHETSPSMADLNYPPHVTLAVYEMIPESVLSKSLISVFAGSKALRVMFDRICSFETPNCVIWAAPENSTMLSDIHTKIHGLINTTDGLEDYQPGNWIPHCTLATRIDPRKRGAALELASQAIEPFEVIFDMADCVEFYPVRIIDECPLSNT